MFRTTKHAARQLLGFSFCVVAIGACSGTGGAGDAGSGGSSWDGTGGAGVGGSYSTGGGGPGVGGSTATGGAVSTGGAPSSGGASSTGGTSSTGGSTSSGGGGSEDPCASASLTWKTGHKTNYESYPDPGSPECVEYNGCYWEGQFAGCGGKKSEAWVEEHNIAALFPNFNDYKLHDICIRSGTKTMVVTVYDTCGDSDCNGCCTKNKGSKDALVDLEKYTNQRWGLGDGSIEWADLGPTTGDGCN